MKRKLFFFSLTILFVSHGMEDPRGSLFDSLNELEQKLEELSFVLGRGVEVEEWEPFEGPSKEPKVGLPITAVVTIDEIKKDFVSDIVGQPEVEFRGRSKGLGWWNGVLTQWDPAQQNDWISKYSRRAAIFEGDFKVHSLSELKRVLPSGDRGHFRILFHDPKNASLSDVHYLQALSENDDAVFQLASTFFGPLEGGMLKYSTLLENMTHAPVQGEWASIGTIGATMWRKYFMPTMYANSVPRRYPNPTYPKIAAAGKYTDQNRAAGKDYFGKYFFLLAPMWSKGLLLNAYPHKRYGNIFWIDGNSIKANIGNFSADDVGVGFHAGIVVSNGRDESGNGIFLDFEIKKPFDLYYEVGKAQRVNQVFASAVDLKRIWNRDGTIDPAMEAFAKLCLKGAYLGTIYSAALYGKKKVYLTLMGGGSFVNDIRWINETFDEDLAQFIKKGGMEVILMYRADTKSRVVDIRNATNDYQFLKHMVHFAEKVNDIEYGDPIQEGAQEYVKRVYAGKDIHASKLATALNEKFQERLE